MEDREWKSQSLLEEGGESGSRDMEGNIRYSFGFFGKLVKF